MDEHQEVQGEHKPGESFDPEEGIPEPEKLEKNIADIEASVGKGIEAPEAPKKKLIQPWLKTTFLVFLLAALGLIAWFYISDSTQSDSDASVTNYAECAAAGYTIGFSDPPICTTPDGEVFRYESEISSYEDCVAAGYPVMESYPEQCAVPGGESFTRQLTEEEQAQLDSQEGMTIPEGWIEKSLDSIGLTIYVPPDWTDTTDPTLFRDSDEYDFESLQLESADDFVLSISANNLPRGYGGIEEEMVLEAVEIDSPSGTTIKYIITEGGDGTVQRIFVSEHDAVVGESMIPVARVSDLGDNGIALEVVGYFDSGQSEGFDTFNSLSEFNSQKDVQTAKQILELMTFNN